MTVKEQFNVVGLPTTWGSTKFRDWRPAQDALAARRLTPAGAIVIGKTNVPVGLWQSYNPVNGTTTNPWDFGRTPLPGAFLRRLCTQEQHRADTRTRFRSARDTRNPGLRLYVRDWAHGAQRG